MPKGYSEAVEQTIQGPKEKRTNNDLQNTTQKTHFEQNEPH
jgi:hypothetical protein